MSKGPETGLPTNCSIIIDYVRVSTKKLYVESEDRGHPRLHYLHSKSRILTASHTRNGSKARRLDHFQYPRTNHHFQDENYLEKSLFSTNFSTRCIAPIRRQNNSRFDENSQVVFKNIVLLNSILNEKPMTKGIVTDNVLN